jgi:hypothetical protein
MSGLSHLHRHTWTRLLRLVLAGMLALGPTAHSLAMVAVADQEAQAMPCHHAERSDASNKSSLTGCPCGNAVQCTCAMAPTLPALPLFTGSAEADDYSVARISLNIHLPPAPEPPPPRL